jgi:predicted dienelactone hydrolase
MNIRMQLIRAGLAVAIIGGAATAETLSPPATDVDCPFAKVAKPQQILLLDPIQKHPTWIDARRESPADTDLQKTVDSTSDDAARGVVTS